MTPGAIGVKRRAVNGVLLRAKPTCCAVDEDVSTLQRDLVAGHARDPLEEALALEVVGDLAALEAEHDQIAASDRYLLLDVDDGGRAGSASS